MNFTVAEGYTSINDSKYRKRNCIFGNPSNIQHIRGQVAASCLEKCRKSVNYMIGDGYVNYRNPFFKHTKKFYEEETDSLNVDNLEMVEMLDKVDQEVDEEPQSQYVTLFGSKTTELFGIILHGFKVNFPNTVVAIHEKSHSSLGPMLDNKNIEYMIIDEDIVEHDDYHRIRMVIVPFVCPIDGEIVDVSQTFELFGSKVIRVVDLAQAVGALDYETINLKDNDGDIGVFSSKKLGISGVGVMTIRIPTYENLFHHHTYLENPSPLSVGRDIIAGTMDVTSISSMTAIMEKLTPSVYKIKKNKNIMTLKRGLRKFGLIEPKQHCDKILSIQLGDHHPPTSFIINSLSIKGIDVSSSSACDSDNRIIRFSFTGDEKFDPAFVLKALEETFEDGKENEIM